MVCHGQIGAIRTKSSNPTADQIQLLLRDAVTDPVSEGDRLPVRYLTADLSSIQVGNVANKVQTASTDSICLTSQALADSGVGTADSVIINFNVDMDDAQEDAMVRRSS